MHVPKQQTSFYQEDKQFLSRSYTSKEEFIREYKKLYRTKAKAEELYLLVLTELEEAISDGNVDSLKKLSNFIDYISDAEDQVTLRDYYDNANNPVKSTNLVILACKHNKVKILEYLLGNNSKILSNLSVGIRETTILPDDEDETCHNGFYYAIRSGNVELLDTLINKWPGNYFAVHFRELDEILSRAYEELKLKNVLLSEEIEIFVENKLINLRFFSSASGQDQNVKSYLNNIRERIELVLQNISLLKAEYSNTEKVDEKFLFIAKFIAQNIHILKRQLKSTYDRLPWEEMEFCLISFVPSHIKRQEMNLFYNATLNKSKILDHLENFAKKLKEEKDIIEGVDIGKFADLPKLKRERVVAEIVSNYPQFGELYSNYQQIRDIHSLEKISDYIKLALSANPKEREGQLIITRVLQVIGEYLKNTLESPKLSSTTSELLLLSLPKNTREVIIDLRNSLSHAYSLSKRTEIEENTDVNFFIGVQNDTKRIDNVITDILYNNKIKIVIILLKKITRSENLDEIKEVAGIFSNVELDEMITESFKVMEHDKLEKLIKELSNNITEKTNYEKELFNKIDNIINFAKTKSKNIRTDYVTAFISLKSLDVGLNDNKIDHNVIRGIKFFANKTLENIPSQIESHNLKEIAELSMKISHSVRSRIQDDNLDKVNRLTCEIFYIAELGTGDLKWIEELRNKLNEKGSFIPIHKQRKAYNITEEKYNNQLELKLSELKSILRNNALSGKLTEKLPSYKRNKKLQAVVEMLVLDIMSILGRSEKHLENNLLFLDDNTPLLTGKCLRNHLAHDNTLVDVLLSDPSIAVILNAKKLTSENIMKSKKKVGKSVRDDPSKLKDKYDQNLITITNQEKMFAALEEGNLEDLKNYLKKGADINARSINSWTTLHFAAKGPSLEIIKFVLNQNLDVNVKDINGQSPLHIAAAYGRKNIVEFFIGKTGVYVDDLDNSGKTSLHIAAKNGHKDAVEILLKNNANTNTKDIAGFSPLHYAIKNNHIDVAKIMLEKEANVDINETMGGFTSLHIAAESGYLGLVNFLLKNEANVNARNDKEGIPLHTAALNGHLEVVNALILKGADVNSRVIDGCTPLHYAIENGHEKIANILLKHGANVNVVDKTYNNTPLHYAAKDGHEKIVKALLTNKANASIATVEGITPLHFAVQSGHLKIVVALLEHGVNIRAKDKNNATPLHYAAESGHKAVAELLIKNGVEINDKANNNLTPLHVAALKGHKDIIELLIRNKAEVRAQDIKGSTPLHAAAMNGSKDIIDLLIKNKAEVDARTNDGITPLHVAALSGHKDAIAFLIKSKAEVNTSANYGLTPLHAAIVGGHKDIVNLLIKNKAKVNTEGIAGSTPLHVAVEGGHKEIVGILVANRAIVNVKSNNLTPLLSAIKHNHKEIVEVLVENGASVNAEGGEPLSLAVLAGYRDIVEILLKNKAHIDIKGPEDATLLHLAAKRGHKGIVNALIERGANVDAMTINSITPLYLAAQEGHEEVAEVLIANKANVNFVNVEGTPLHIAAGHGHVNVVEVLLSNRAKVNVKDNKSRTPLELAVAHGHLQVVKMLLQYKKVDMNAKGNDDWTILHIASQESNLEMVKCLVDEGSNINAKNASGSKPIHIAAREGYKDTVEFFLSKGLSINELGTANQTLLHYAAMKGRLEVVKYLIAQGADVNAKDTNGLTPMHIAANFGYKDVIEVLLKNGAVYNAVDKLCRRPLEMTNDKDVINLLASTEKLFEAVKRNSSSEVENYIKAGAFVNAKNADSVTPLYYAAWKGYDGVVNILLQNKANPNVVGNKGFTPLHYAAKFSHLKVVKALLSNGAVYNAVSDSGKTPSDFTVDKSITSLFKLVSESFKKVKDGNAQVINDLNKIKDIDTVKAVMSARNRENKTLVVAAVHSNFSKVEQLKQISQSDVSAQIDTALVLLNQGNYQKALSIFRSAFERRKEILGPDNPGTLDIQTYIAKVLYKQGIYQEALNMLKEIFQKQKEMLGLNDKDTLSTRSTIALVLHRQGKDEEAFNIYQEVYQRQKEILGSNHSDTLNTQFHMALVLDKQGKYEEALNINRAVFEKRKETLGTHDLATVSAKNNIAMVLANQGKYEESLKIYKEVFEKKKIILGINHADTLRTLHNIAGVLFNQNKYHEALKAFQEVLNIQKKALQQNHPETLNTQYNIANVLFAQGKWISALKVYRESLDQRKAVFGPSHPSVLDILKKIEMINFRFKLEGSEASEVLQHLQKDINIAASKGDIQTVQRLLKDGADANDKDIDGRTPLHYAVSNGHIDIVNILLTNGANVSQVTNKGNTPLHTATSKCYKEIVEVLLQHISRDKLNDFVNAKTTSSGTTSLHVAAKGGSLEVVKSLLKHGAIYKIENKEGKIPIDLSKDQRVTNLLKLIEELFRDIKNGNVESISKLRAVKPNEFLAITNARNNQGNTLLQVAIANKHKNIATKLLKMLKEPDQVQSQFSPECELDQLEKLKSATEVHIRFSELYLPMLRSMSQPYSSEKNTSPWKTLKEGSYYLGNAYRLVEVYKDCVPGSINNKSIQSVNDMLVTLEFDPKHITSGYTDEAYGGKAECFVSKGQGTKYYKLLHSELKKDVRSFIEMVELNIDIPVKRFLESINQRLQSAFSEKLLEAIENDNPLAVENCIKRGVIVNFKDTDGRTPLHHAVNNGNIDVVSTLLKNGAEVAQITNKGNTPLHIASSKGYREVVEVLLQYVSRDELNDFINARTTSGGTTSLHVAVKNGFLEVVKSLLKHGATYNIENKEGKTPINLSKDHKVANLLKLVEELFEGIKKGNVEIINKLRVVKQDEFLAVTSARNNQGNTLLQVAIANGHKNVADKLLEMLKKPDQNLQDVNIESGVKSLKL
ncbi:MAG: ankyrin repeat domain-containing protein [Wolbachia endosymbiont of Homalodisca vitripennis]|nr:ankyrin repeat domain-containing protein [Wolbachia endosymbiont of Homalodisca vitripennis]MCJ7475874.1 ankyrin repeat domain-containing protein [Wolbachia endosymbiont of Homalodisca vitripennis]